MRRFWFRFKQIQQPSPLNLGLGVTARDKNDAAELVKEQVFPDSNMPEVIEIIEDIDVSVLEDRHVKPNIGDVAQRGIWFPVGYRKRSECR